MKLAPVVRVAPSKRPLHKAGWKRLLFFWRRDDRIPAPPAPPRTSYTPKPSVLSARPSAIPGGPGPSGDLRLSMPGASAPPPAQPNPFLPSIPLSTRPPPVRSEAPTPILPPPLPAPRLAPLAPAAPPPPPRLAPSTPRRIRSGSSIAPVAAETYVRPTVPIRAIAVAHDTANAVGTVELSCASAGLRLRFVRISAWTEGYVPYPATITQSVVVPYDQVARVVIDGDGLVHLVVDPSCTPYNRLVLAGLVHDVTFDHRSSHRRRARIERNVSIAALLAWIPVTLAISGLFPSLSPVLVAALALTASGIVHTLRGELASRLVLFSARSEKVRDELLGELALHLPPGRVSEQMASTMPVPSAAPAELGEPDAVEAGSLRGLFFTAGVAAAAAVVAILVGRSLIVSTPEPAAVNDDPWVSVGGTTLPAAQLPAAASAPIQPDPVKPKVVLPPCVCERADSPLWNEGIPRLSVVARNRPGPTSPERPSMYPEIAVVNNTADDLKDVVLTVDFLYGGTATRKPRVLDTKDLFWEGRLGPGKAVKWRVKGRGDDFRVKSFVSGTLGDPGTKPAPADSFYELSTTARTPSVRIHGAKMLAWLGDSRVADVLEKLRRDGRAEFADTLEQLTEASRPLRVCGVRANPAADVEQALRVEACVFNAGTEGKESPLVAARSHRADQTRESRWTVEATIAPGTGVLTSGIVDVPEGDQGDVQAQLVVEP